MPRAAERKCAVGPCPRFFRPGVTGSNGRCSRCAMRKRREQPDITEAQSQLAEARAAGEISARSSRLVGYVRPELAQLAQEGVEAKRFESESDIVNRGVALLLGREDLL